MRLTKEQLDWVDSVIELYSSDPFFEGQVMDALLLLDKAYRDVAGKLDEINDQSSMGVAA